MAIGTTRGPSLLKTYSSAACNTTLTHDKCVLGCTTFASNILNLNLTPNPKLGVPKLGYIYS